MKILHLCNKIPYPANDGGAIAVLNMALALANQGNSVHVLAMNTHKHHADTRDIPETLSSKIHFSYVKADTRIRAANLLLNLVFSKKPYNATRFESKAFACKLTELLRKEQFDIVQLEGLYLGYYLPSIRKLHPGKIVYRAHNIESEIWTGRAASENHLLKKVYLKLIARRMLRYERRFINQYDLLLPITQTDLDTFSQMGNTRPAHVCYTGILETAWRDKPKTGTPAELFFIGALDWIPNQEGLIWFIDKVWPLLEKDNMQLHLHVAGRNAPEVIRKKCRTNAITFHGEVEDALEFMDEHDMMIVPLFTGSGLRIKIVEAMARSQVIISTSCGARGLPAITGSEIIIADRAEEWKDQLGILLKDNHRFASIGRSAYAYAKENFSNRAIINKLFYFYREQGIC